MATVVPAVLGSRERVFPTLTKPRVFIESFLITPHLVLTKEFNCSIHSSSRGKGQPCSFFVWTVGWSSKSDHASRVVSGKSDGGAAEMWYSLPVFSVKLMTLHRPIQQTASNWFYRQDICAGFYVHRLWFIHKIQRVLGESLRSSYDLLSAHAPLSSS